MSVSALTTPLLTTSMDLNSFYKRVIAFRNKNICSPTKVVYYVDNKNATELCLKDKHYSTLVNSGNETVDRDGLLSYLNDCSGDHSDM